MAVLTLVQAQLVKVSISFLVGCVATFIFCSLLLRLLARVRTSVPVKPELLVTQASKAGTPSMGGISFLCGITVSLLICSSLNARPLWLVLIAIWLFGLVGLADDLMKERRHDSDGLTSKVKLLLQMVCAVMVVFLQKYLAPLDSTVFATPWNPAGHDIGIWYRVLSVLYLMYYVNAVNITDGLDGLATRTAMPILLLLTAGGAVMSVCPPPYSTSASYGQIVAILCAGAFGSMLAFLWFNGGKASIFMGDSGSHTLGAVIAISAMLVQVEVVTLVAGFVFLVELLSSMLQIIAINVFHTKLLPIAPLHHAYEQMGYGEGKIVDRFSIASWLCVGVSTVLLIVKW